MISLEAKTQTKSSPISSSLSKATQDEPSVSFSDLLKGAKNSKDAGEIQNGAFVLSLDTKEVKTIPLSLKTDEDTLVGLLKGEAKALEETVSVLELNPKITKKMTTEELKVLIQDAKKFLKEKIIESDDYKKAQVKDLPKTLKGLAEMAKSFGVDLTKISLEEVRPDVKRVSARIINKNEDRVDKDVKVSRLNTTEINVEQETNTSVKTKDVKPKSIHLNISESISQVIKEKEDIKINDKKVETVREIKATPLFKAQEKVELTTEQIVQTKQFKAEEKTPARKADETLKLLLRGEKPTTTHTNATADFSVATARVIAPSATTELTKSFEQLLQGSPEESTSKIDGLNVNKADSFEVKLNEAKQMIKYLSQDVKTAIEDYKSPFTRIKVQLNPQQMGEVDVTVIQRGKNLHVNISSNTVAINTLAMNANELKTQLNTNGINNASLNFNNSGQNSEQQASQQQQHRQNERHADEEYNYFEQQEQAEEILSSLEIVVPNYA